MRQFHLDAIRQFEGFSARATWDYKQHTNGYGTRAKFPGEIIDRAEAERRFNAEIEEARATVARFAPHLDQGTGAALTSLTFNAGTSWMRAGLGTAIKNGDIDTARSIFKMYTHAGGQSLPGLEARRQIEVQWFGQENPQASTPRGSPRSAEPGRTAVAAPTEPKAAATISSIFPDRASEAESEALPIHPATIAGTRSHGDATPSGFGWLYLAILDALTNIDTFMGDGRRPYSSDEPFREGGGKDYPSSTT